MGRSHLRLPDRGISARGRGGTEQLAPLFSHSRMHFREPDRRCRVRSLSPARAGSRSDEAARTGRVSIQHLLVAHLSRGTRSHQPSGVGLLRQSGRRAPQPWHRSVRHALPLGPTRGEIASRSGPPSTSRGWSRMVDISSASTLPVIARATSFRSWCTSFCARTHRAWPRSGRTAPRKSGWC